ncbi:MAG TPA: M48 family metallopeptidase [Thermodesulfobacteriota bacterium]|nr:M48 family metallopeptidase [Thermodesulfobacteriota bacterium]HNU71052.1 M48 family metallopeptidase [Thermodesulfobacteriota bacterium]HOC38808.1 M48 family metallopeptidase [Thermodesulfobacteriota bacterium]
MAALPHSISMRAGITYGILLAISLCLWSCRTVPITGRQQLDLVSSGEVMQMSNQEYAKFLSTHQMVQNTPEAAMVNSVGRRIQTAVERYFAQTNEASHLSGYQWEFNLVQDASKNAWAMPGGKVVVYTGILPVTQNECGLATVMAHEIAHAIAGHGEERMSQSLLTELGGMALSQALSQQPGATQQLFMTAFGLGSQIGVLLPYSRLQESEADHLGLVFMSMAGYDPRCALDFWQRMAASGQGGGPPEFLSTHPADENRIQSIQELIPEALQYQAR